MKCKGENCNADGTNDHSPECISEHNGYVHFGAGNRNPDARIRGYKGEQLRDCASDDEVAAWEEGAMARERKL